MPEERWWQDQLVSVPDDLVISLVFDTVQDQLSCVSLRVFRRSDNTLLGRWLDPVAPGQDPWAHVAGGMRRVQQTLREHLSTFPAVSPPLD